MAGNDALGQGEGLQPGEDISELLVGEEGGFEGGHDAARLADLGDDGGEIEAGLGQGGADCAFRGVAVAGVAAVGEEDALPPLNGGGLWIDNRRRGRFWRWGRGILALGVCGRGPWRGLLAGGCRRRGCSSSGLRGLGGLREAGIGVVATTGARRAARSRGSARSMRAGDRGMTSRSR